MAPRPTKKTPPPPKPKPKYVTLDTFGNYTGGSADTAEAQIGNAQPKVPDLADRQPEPYISEQMKLYLAWLKKQKDKALGDGGGGSKALTEAQKLANELAMAKLQLEYDKIDAAAEKVITDREATELEKSEAKAERERKFSALNKVADIYSQQGKDSYDTSLGRIKSLYGQQESDINSQRGASLDALLQAVNAGSGQISGAEQQFLSSLVTPTAYSNVPLVDLGQTPQSNPLMGALQAEGADTSGVTAQSATDAALAQQYAQLVRNTAGQLNTGNRNYMDALRNAGIGAAAAGRQGLATGKAQYTNQINSKYDDLANQLAMQRMEALQRAEDARNASETQTAVSRAEAAQYAPTQAPVTQQPATQDPAPIINDTRPTVPAYVGAPPPEQGGGRGAMYTPPAQTYTPDAEAAMRAAQDAAAEEERRRLIEQIVASRRGGY